MHDLRLLNSFVHAARNRSFTAAASVLDCTPGAISRNIAKLEQEVGVRLFNRTTREFSLTEEGARYYEAVSAGLTALDRADDLIGQSRGEVAGTVRLSIASFGKSYALGVLARLYIQHPNLHLEIGFVDDPGDLVAQNLDLAIRNAKLDDSRYICRSLGQLELKLVATPGYLEQYGPLSHPTDLLTRECINVRDNDASCAWRFFPPPHSGETTVDVDPPCRFRITDQLDATVDAALTGMAPTVVCAKLARPHLDTGRLVELLPDWRVRPQGASDDEIYLCYPHRDYMPARIRVVIDALSRGPWGEQHHDGKPNSYPASSAADPIVQREIAAG